MLPTHAFMRVRMQRCAILRNLTSRSKKKQSPHNVNVSLYRIIRDTQDDRINEVKIPMQKLIESVADIKAELIVVRNQTQDNAVQLAIIPWKAASLGAAFAGGVVGLFTLFGQLQIASSNKSDGAQPNA